MRDWLSRMFRSRLETLAEKAEVEGRFEDAARLYVESGAPEEAFRVLMRAAETAQDPATRRDFLTRAYSIAPSEEAQNSARKALALLALAEAEISPPCDEHQRQRLREAAKDLERTGAFREAARAYKCLGDRQDMERALMLAGEIEEYEREAGADEETERYQLRRRHAIESFETLWKLGDRIAALTAIDRWLQSRPTDTQARLLRDERRALLIQHGRFEARIGHEHFVVVGSFPVTLGREGHVVVRGASVSREHCVIDCVNGTLTVRDNGSRNGTQLNGFPLAGSVALASEQVLGLGNDLSLRVDASDGVTVLRIERGMDRGRRIVLVTGRWSIPLGTVRFTEGRAVLEPHGPVYLAGQRVVAPIVLARNDRIEADGTTMEVLQ